MYSVYCIVPYRCPMYSVYCILPYRCPMYSVYSLVPNKCPTYSLYCILPYRCPMYSVYCILPYRCPIYSVYCILPYRCPMYSVYCIVPYRCPMYSVHLPFTRVQMDIYAEYSDTHLIIVLVYVTATATWWMSLNYICFSVSCFHPMTWDLTATEDDNPPLQKRHVCASIR